MKMTKEKMDPIMFAPCGMNCIVCYKHCYHDKPCDGCLNSDRGKPEHCRKCKIKDCVKGKGLSYCFKCSDYPGGYADAEEGGRLCLLAEQIRVTSCELFIRQMERYSNRREEKMDFSGILGSMTGEGDLTPFTPWLSAARILHVGRNVTFGFGKVELAVW